MRRLGGDSFCHYHPVETRLLAGVLHRGPGRSEPGFNGSMPGSEGKRSRLAEPCLPCGGRRGAVPSLSWIFLVAPGDLPMRSRGAVERLSEGRIHRISVIAVSSVGETSLIQERRVNHEPQAVVACVS